MLHDVHLWVGKYTAKDHYKGVAYLIVELATSVSGTQQTLIFITCSNSTNQVPALSLAILCLLQISNHLNTGFLMRHSRGYSTIRSLCRGMSWNNYSIFKCSLATQDRGQLLRAINIMWELCRWNMSKQELCCMAALRLQGQLTHFGANVCI